MLRAVLSAALARCAISSGVYGSSCFFGMAGSILKRDHKPSFTENSLFVDSQDRLSEAQWAGIGRLAIEYNYVEDGISELFVEAINIRGKIAFELSSRVSSIDTKIQTILSIGSLIDIPRHYMKHISNVLGEKEFLLLKGYRNCVVHSKIFDEKRSIATITNNKGNTFDILLTIEALRGLYNRFEILEREIARFRLIFRISHRILSLQDSDEKRKRNEEFLQECFLQSQNLQLRRLGLPPLPEVPDPLPFPASWDFEPIELS